MLESIRFFYDDVCQIASAYGRLSDGYILKCSADLSSEIKYGTLDKREEEHIVARTHSRMAVEMINYRGGTCS